MNMIANKHAKAIAYQNAMAFAALYTAFFRFLSPITGAARSRASA